MNGFQSREHAERKLRMSRAAPWPRESHTAPQKRDQSHCESSAIFGGGDARSSSDVED